jgi:uncharacterized caspase-like protein
MAKVALLIGVSEYSSGLKPLPAPPKDVAAMQEVLQNPEMGAFDDVKTLINPNHWQMEEEIEIWFKDRQSDDLLLLFFSGHGVKDESRELYFATCNTRKDQRGELIKSTAVPAGFVRSCLKRCKSKRQVVILDCCFSGAFGDLLAKDDGDVDLESQLGTEGGVVLTSSSSLQYSFEQEGSDLSIYTRYLVEGIKTGAADRDSDGRVSVGELHEYASKKVQADASAMTPKIIVLKDEGYKIKLAKALIADPKLKYRKEAERLATESISQGMPFAYEGRFSPSARVILDDEWDRLGLSQDEAKEIEVQVLQPYIEHQNKLKKYSDALIEELQCQYPLSAYASNNLKDYQKRLRLSDEDVEGISKPVISRKEAEYQKLQAPEIPPQQSAGDTTRQQPQQQSTLTTPSKPQTETDDLRSERGVDYTKLRDLLASGQWKEADQETLAVMLKAANREQEGYLQIESIEKFPCTDLLTIDQLWVKYSNGRFGFSVQKRIWESVGGKPGESDYEIYKKFGDRVGWLKWENKWLGLKFSEQWQSYDDIICDLNAPLGIFQQHLPAVFARERMRGGGGLFSRAGTCKL